MEVSLNTDFWELFDRCYTDKEDFSEFAMEEEAMAGEPELNSAAVDEDPLETQADTVDARCELCKFGLNMIRQNVQGMSIEQLNSYCNMLPSAIQSMCTQLKAGSGILNPRLLCASSCPASDSAEDTQDLQIVQDNQVIEDEPVEIDQDEPVSQELEVPLKGVLHINGESGDLPCEICKELIKVFVFEINNNLGTLQNYIKDICNQLPDPTNDKCDDFVDSKLPTLLHDLIEKFLSSANACSLLKMCPKEQQFK
ncbi:hypothetical protein ScPMuIL_004297 [Solemya velum]